MYTQIYKMKREREKGRERERERERAHLSYEDLEEVADILSILPFLLELVGSIWSTVPMLALAE